MLCTTKTQLVFKVHSLHHKSYNPTGNFDKDFKIPNELLGRGFQNGWLRWPCGSTDWIPVEALFFWGSKMLVFHYRFLNKKYVYQMVKFYWTKFQNYISTDWTSLSQMKWIENIVDWMGTKREKRIIFFRNNVYICVIYCLSCMA